MTDASGIVYRLAEVEDVSTKNSIYVLLSPQKLYCGEPVSIGGNGFKVNIKPLAKNLTFVTWVRV
jgi:hypothetical protein